VTLLSRKYRPDILRYATSALRDREWPESVTPGNVFSAARSSPAGLSIAENAGVGVRWSDRASDELIRGACDPPLQIWPAGPMLSAVDVKAVRETTRGHQQSRHGNGTDSRVWAGSGFGISSAAFEGQKAYILPAIVRDMELSEIAAATAKEVNASKSQLPARSETSRLASERRTYNARGRQERTI